MIKDLLKIYGVSALIAGLFISAFFVAYGATPRLTVPQGGTDNGSFTNYPVVGSSTNSSGGLSASSTLWLVGIRATSSIGIATTTNGLNSQLGVQGSGIFSGGLSVASFNATGTSILGNCAQFASGDLTFETPCNHRVGTDRFVWTVQGFPLTGEYIDLVNFGLEFTDSVGATTTFLALVGGNNWLLQPTIFGAKAFTQSGFQLETKGSSLSENSTVNQTLRTQDFVATSSILVTGASSTITNVTIVNATSTAATTTYLYVGDGALFKGPSTTILGNLRIGGNINTGVWNASTILTSKGGTGLTTFLDGDLLYGNSSPGAALNKLPIGTNQILVSDGSAPSWALTVFSDGLKLGVATSALARAFSVQGNALVSGNLAVANFTATGTTMFNGLAYTWPSSQSASTCLQTDGSGLLSWGSCGSQTPWTSDISGSGFSLSNVSNITATGSLLVTNATSTITNLNMVNSTSTNATSTTLYVNGSTIITGASTTITQLRTRIHTNTNSTSTALAATGIFNAANFRTGTTSSQQTLAITGSGIFSGNFTAANITATGTLLAESATTTGRVAVGTTTTNGTFSLQGLNDSLPLAVFASSSGDRVFRITQGGHLEFGASTTPSVSSCGTAPGIRGTDSVGTVVIGTGVVSSCTVTFGTTWTVKPRCFVNDSTTGGLSVRASPATSSVAIITTTAFTAGDEVDYMCLSTFP